MHNMTRTHQGGADRAPTAKNDVATQHNEQEVYVPNENYRNPSKQAKHQRELLQSSGGISYVGQDLRCVRQQPWGRNWHLGVFRTTISPFQD